MLRGKILALAGALFISTVGVALGGSYSWDPAKSGGTNGSGSGVWSTSTALWYNGTSDVIWASNTIAVFGGAAGGTVTVDPAGVTVGGITVSTTGYTLTGGSINFAANAIITANQNVTINNRISSTGNTLFNEGTGTVTYTGSMNAADFHTEFGSVVLSGTINTTGFCDIGDSNGNNASMTINNGGRFIEANSDFNVSDQNQSIGQLTMQVGSSAACHTLYVGKTGTSIGIMTMNGGTMAANSGGGDDRIGGAASSSDAGAYGNLVMAGPTALLSTPNNFQMGAYGLGMLNMTAGTITSSGYNDIGRWIGGIGVANISGGQWNQTGAGQIFFVGEGGQGILNMLSGGTGSVTCAGGMIIGNSDSGSATNGIVNLSGGTITTTTISTTGGTLSAFNFNGGYLKASAATATFMQGLSVHGNNSGAYVWQNGGTIDNGGNAITIGQSLLAPSGSGLSSITVSSSGSGYLGEPVVTVTGGGGNGATARAIMSGGVITSFVVTNAGVGYTSAPTITIAGGGDTSAATATAVTIAANPSSGTLTFNGAGTTTLSGTNTYGGSFINAGVLAFATTNAVTPAAGSTTIGLNGSLLGSGIYNAAAPITGWLNSGHITPNSTGTILISSGSTDSEAIALSATSSLLSLGAQTAATYSGVLTSSASTYYLGGAGGVLTVASQLGGANGVVVGNGGNGSVIFTGSNSYTGPTVLNNSNTLQLAYTGASAYAGAISGPGSVLLSAGTVTLSGNNTYTGNTNINSGAVSLSGTLANGAASTLTIGAASTPATFSTSGSVNVFQLYLGTANGATGAIYQTGGNVAVTRGGNTGDFQLGEFASTANGSGDSFGYYKISGGTLSMNEVGIAGANGGNGQMDVTGGLVQDAGCITVSRATLNAQTGILNVSGGTMISTGGNGLQLNWGTLPGTPTTAIVTVSGSGVLTSNPTVLVSLNNQGGSTGAGNVGIINLNGGLFTAPGITSNGVGTGLLNLNGGTLAATGGNATLIGNITAATIYSGGAYINNNGNSETISQALLAPTGSGVLSIATTAGGSGYVSPPIVTLSGNGTVATAIATISGGSLAGIVITNPGTGYTSPPTVTISGGGGSGAGIAVPSLLTNSTTGGLTSMGSGVLSLTSTASSFGGNVVVNGGTLQAATSNNTINPATSVLGNAQLSSRSIIVNNGGTLLFTASSALGASGLLTDTVNTPIIINQGGTVTSSTASLNNILGNVVLSGGTLGGGPGASGTLATWQLSTGSVTVNTAPSLMTASGSFSGFNMAPTTTFNVAATGGSAADLTVSGVLADSQVAGNPSTLFKTGNGNMLLSANNSYTGATNVSSGTLSLSNANNNNIGGSSAITVFSGATLNTTGLSGGALTLGSTQTLSGSGTVLGGITTSGAGSKIIPGSLTSIGTLSTGNLNLSAGGNLSFVLGTPGPLATSTGTSSSISVSGSVTLPGSAMGFNLLNNAGNNGQGSIGSGWYDLINYTGSLVGTPSSAFGTGFVAKTYSFSTVTVGPVNQLEVNLQTLAFNWTGLSGGTGAADSGWNTTSSNWSLGNSAASYIDGAVVAFGDSNAVTSTPITNSAVVLSSNFQPTSITFSNSAVNYSLTGTGTISGATGITLNGTGMVSIATSNSFTGPVAISAGALNISNSAALGSTTGVAVANGAALQLQGGISASALLSLNGTGWASAPAGALSNISGGNTYSGAITLAGSATIGASAGTLSVTGGVNNSGNLLTVASSGTTLFQSQPIIGGGGLRTTGPGTTVLGAANFYLGPTTANSGVLQLGNSAAIPTVASAGNVTVNGTLDLNGLGVTVNGLNGVGAVTSTSAGTLTFSIGNNNAGGTFDGAIGDGNGTTSLKKIGTGLAVLDGANSYSGATTVSSGTLQIGSGGSTGKLGGNSPATIASGAALVFDRSDAAYTYNAATISNSGTVTSISSGTVTMNNIFSNAGTITSTGAGQFVLNGGITNTGVVGPNSSGSVLLNGNITNSNLVTTYGSGYVLLAGVSTGGILANNGAGVLEISSSGNSATNFFSQTGTTNIDAGASVNSTLATSIGHVNADYGTVNLSGSLTSGTDLNVSDAAGSTGILNVNATGIATAVTLYVGKSGNSAGALTISGGTVQYSAGAGDWRVGGGASTSDSASYGSVTVTGGQMTTPNNFQVGAYGLGVLNQTGGVVSTLFYPVVGRFTTGNGVYNISGGTLKQLGAGNALIIGEQGAGVLNVSGSGLVSVAGGLWLTNAGDSVSTTQGIVNLRGGTISAPLVQGSAIGTSTFNFNGGVLQATAGGTLLSNLTAAYVYSGGAVIDTQANTTTISQSLLAPDGSGLNVAGGTIAVASGGSGYIGAPIVTLSGSGGSGATAIANINGSGQVTSLTITNPGRGYTGALTASFSGGLAANGAGVAATPPSLPAVTPDTSGGLTKLGAGTLILSASNTYQGPTNILGGMVQFPASALHQWSFNNGSLADSIGTSNATVITGSGSVAYTSSGVTLSGGAGSGAHTNSYISLGTNLLPTSGGATIELWATQNQIQQWSRIFDFGSTNANYLMMSWTQGTTLASDQVDFNTATQNITGNNTVAPYNLGQEYHIALEVTPNGTGSIINWYVAPSNSGSITVKSGSFATTNSVLSLTQTNMWLGQSEFAGDSTASASYDEVRIWGSPLPLSVLNAAQNLGPNTLSNAYNYLPANEPVLISGGGTLNLNGWNQTISSLSSSDSTTGLSLGIGILTTGGDNLNTTFAGTISGAGGGLNKVGTGTFTLAGVGTNTGTTVINSGTLYLANSAALAGSTLVYDNQGGTLSLGSLASVALGGLSGGENLPLVNLSGASVPLTVGANAQNTTYTGVLSEGTAPGASLTKIGNGTLTLTNSGAFSGGVVVNAGVLAITNGLALGSGTADTIGVPNANTGQLALSNNITVSGITATMSGNGGDLLGAIRSTSGTNTWAGAIILGDTNSRSGEYAGSELVVAGVISSGTPGNGLFIRALGGGTVQVTAANTYSGPTTIISGELQIAGGNDRLPTGQALALGNGSAIPVIFDLNGFNQTVAGLQQNAASPNSVINSGTTGATFTINTAAPADNFAYGGTIADGNAAISLVKNGPGTQQLTGSNSYSGGTFVNGGILQIASDAALGTVPGAPATNVTLNNGQLYNDGGALSLNAFRNITITGSSYFEPGYTGASAFVVNGNISGSGSLGVVWDQGTLVLNGSDTYLGSTTIGTTGNGYNNGVAATPTLQLGNSAALPVGTDVYFGIHPNQPSNVATLDLNGNSVQIGALSGGSNAVVDNVSFGGNITVQAGLNDHSGTFAGVIRNSSGIVNLYKTGTGSLLLSGPNTYSGSTSIAGGSLVAGAADTLPLNSAVFLSGGTLDITAAVQAISSFTATGGVLNMNVNNVLSVSNFSTLGGTLNVFGLPSGSLVDLINLTGSYTGSFTAGTLPGGYSLSYNPNLTELDLVSSGPNMWIGPSGSWNTPANWSSGSAPNSQAAVALLGLTPTSATTISLDTAQTLGALTFNNAAGYTLTAGSLTMDNTGGTGDAQIVVLSGTHSIDATVTLTLAGTNTAISAINSGALNIAGNILDGTGGSSALSFSSSDGTGLLTLSGTNSFGGGLFVTSGNVILNGANSLMPGTSLSIGGMPLPGAAFSAPMTASAHAASANLAPVPEPGTLALLAVLCSAVACYRFSRRPASRKT